MLMAWRQAGKESVFVSTYIETRNVAPIGVMTIQLSKVLGDSSRCFKTEKNVYQEGCGGLALGILRAANPHQALQGSNALIENVEVRPQEIQTLIYVRTSDVTVLQAARPIILAYLEQFTGMNVKYIP